MHFANEWCDMPQVGKTVFLPASPAVRQLLPRFVPRFAGMKAMYQLAAKHLSPDALSRKFQELMPPKNMKKSLVEDNVAGCMLTVVLAFRLAGRSPKLSAVPQPIPPPSAVGRGGRTPRQIS